MRLHLDRDAFEAIILEVEKATHIRSDVLEKDYYVTLMLKELSDIQDECKAYFKGGTALYKALGSLNRFSEDIDLTVYVKDCPTTSQKKKRLESAAEGYKCLARLPEDQGNFKSKGNITAIYGYEPIFQTEIPDSLQRFGRVKVEATSFTVSEPTEVMLIEPVLFNKATEEQKIIMKDKFGVYPFGIETIKLGRIFVDKIFAVEFYYQRVKEPSLHKELQNNAAFDAAKHLYDLTVLFELPAIKLLLENLEYLSELIALKRQEELVRIGGIKQSLAIKNFSYLDKVLKDQGFSSTFSNMQKTYVFNDEYKRPLQSAASVIDAIKKIG